MAWDGVGNVRVLLVAGLATLGCFGGGEQPRSGSNEDAAIDADARISLEPAIERDCGGQRPALDECVVGGFFADCGGEGGPRLACSESADDGDCRWFSGGCVADGYASSACPASDICCEMADAAGPSWPYRGGAFAESLERRLFGWSLEPIGLEENLAIDVETDETVTVPDTFTCTGDPYNLTYDDPCSGSWSPTSVGVQMRDTVLIVPLISSLAGWRPVIEYVPADLRPGPGAARICVYRFTDVRGNYCTGLENRERWCAESGTLTLDRIPTSGDLAGLTGHLVADFGTFTLEGGFVAD